MKNENEPCVRLTIFQILDSKLGCDFWWPNLADIFFTHYIFPQVELDSVSGQWPLLLDLTKDECRKALRALGESHNTGKWNLYYYCSSWFLKLHQMLLQLLKLLFNFRIKYIQPSCISVESTRRANKGKEKVTSWFTDNFFCQLRTS